MRTALSAVVVGTTLALLVAGCAGGRNPSPSGSTTASGAATETVPAVTPSPAPSEDRVPVPKNASTDRSVQSPAAGSQLVLTAVRTASHTGVDRVVFEFAGSGAPGWTVEYVDRAIAQGSGQSITVAGSSVLRVSMTGTAYPTEASPSPSPVARRIPGDGAGIVTEVVQDGTFEGDTVSFIGLSGERRPFAVQTIQSPTRVIVDIVR